MHAPMPLLLTGRGFRRDLEANGCLAVHAPLEGGAETRLLRRLRAAGYRTRMTSQTLFCANRFNY